MKNPILLFCVTVSLFICGCSHSSEKLGKSVSLECQRVYWIEDSITGEQITVDSAEYAQYYHQHGGIIGQLTNVPYRIIVRQDTILAEGYVRIDDYVSHLGIREYRATWCDKTIAIDGKAATDILSGGSKPYVVVGHYNNGEVIRQRIIAKGGGE